MAEKASAELPGPRRPEADADRIARLDEARGARRPAADRDPATAEDTVSRRESPAPAERPASEPKPEPPAGPAEPSGADEEAPSPRRRAVRWGLFALLPIALVAGGYWYVTGGSVMSSDNAYVQADTVAITTDVSGIVKTIAVRDNQPVAAGDVLFRLDDQPFQLALTRADAQLGTTRNTIEALKASYADMQQQILQAQADVDFYNREYQRQKDLAARNVAAQTTLDQAVHNLRTAQLKVGSLTQQLAGIRANLSGNPDIAVEDHPSYIEAKAQRDEAARQLSHTIVRAPMAGVVTNVPALQVGQYLPASTAAFSIVATDHVWVQAQPKETELTYVRPGQAVTVTVDTYPTEEWHGTVDSISPATGSSFSLLPAQNTSGNWVKVVQRIPIRVRIETPPDKPPLRVGMSVEIDVDTGHPRGLPAFVRRWLGSADNDDGKRQG